MSEKEEKASANESPSSQGAELDVPGGAKIGPVLKDQEGLHEDVQSLQVGFDTVTARLEESLATLSEAASQRDEARGQLYAKEKELQETQQALRDA